LELKANYRDLLALAASTPKNRATTLGLDELLRTTGHVDLDTETSVYQRLLDEDIIIEETPKPSLVGNSVLARMVSFVYDEFYDYVLARALVIDRQWNVRSVADISKDFVDILSQSIAFQQLRGVAVYLILFAERRGFHQQLCRIAGKLGQVEILSSVLPTFGDASKWAADILVECVKTVDACSRKGEKFSMDWRKVFRLKGLSLE
jgi:hypothetical protein